MWQKCPICNGTGIDPGIYSLNKCSVCQGMKIISEVTGLPPASVPPSSNIAFNIKHPIDVLEEHYSKKGTDFKDAPMESQDEYFGRK